MVLENGIRVSRGNFDPNRGTFEISAPWSGWVEAHKNEMLATGTSVKGPHSPHGDTGNTGGVTCLFENDKVEIHIYIWNWQGNAEIAVGRLPLKETKYLTYYFRQFSSLHEILELVLPLFRDLLGYVPGGDSGNSISTVQA
jgi:hypothetical protein